MKKKVFLKSSEYTRPDAVGEALKTLGKTANEKEVIKLANKLFKEKTGKPENDNESKAILKLVKRFLRTYEPTVKPTE